VKKNHQTKRADQIGEVLEDFRTWLDKKANLYETVASPAENEVLIIEFIDHLVKNNTPKATVSNYKSDLLQFVTYLSRNFKYLPLKECGQKNKIFSEYANYLSYKLQLSESTVKRKLSSLQSFWKWGVKKGLLEDPSTPPAGGSVGMTNNANTFKGSILQGMAILLRRFPLTRYLSWMIGVVMLIALSLGLYQQLFLKTPKPLAFPTEPVRPARILNFQGRLTDSSGVPIIIPQQILFRVWNADKGGSVLYQTDVCTITPDQNGIFNTLIGSTCGTEIPSSLFSENISLFLGITVDGDEEMDPRQQLATVGYAINSETLQGLPPSSPAGPATIPFIDKNGQLVISAASPTIKSTTGKFTVEGKTLTFQTASGSNGSINLNPDNSACRGSALL